MPPDPVVSVVHQDCWREGIPLDRAQSVQGHQSTHRWSPSPERSPAPFLTQSAPFPRASSSASPRRFASWTTAVPVCGDGRTLRPVARSTQQFSLHDYPIDEVPPAPLYPSPISTRSFLHTFSSAVG